SALGHLMMRALVLLAALALTACGEPKVEEQKATLYVFGTQVDLLVRGADEATFNKATAQITKEFQHMHTDWHAWKPGELTELNHAFAAGESKAVSAFLLPLIKQAKTLSAMSDGLFNPAVGGLVAAWGFHNDERPKGHHPDLAAIRALAALRPSMEDVRIHDTEVASQNPAVQLDFGAFAKGVALDRAEQLLGELGIEHALINAGGDINTLGSGGEEPWQVGIRDPKVWGVLATLTLRDGEDVYTSGNYERFREIDGVRYAHIIDPRTGMPVDHIVSATVITRGGALADAAATALSVAGAKDWHGIAQGMGIKYVVLVDDQGTLYANPAMAARLSFPPDVKPTIVESPPL
ncbi:FAD:protein FMN transferase, partial [Pseudomonadota bacterium]